MRAINNKNEKSQYMTSSSKVAPMKPKALEMHAPEEATKELELQKVVRI